MIKLDDKHRLTADKYQYIIQKRTIIEDETSKNFGSEVWKNEAFLPKIQNVLRYMINNEIKENLESIEKVIEAVNNLENKFEDLLKAKR